MKNFIAKSKLIEIIMPPLIGDCIMAFPLINRLKFENEIILICNDYVFDIIQYLQKPVKTKRLIDDNNASDIIIDFLSNEESANYIRNSKANFSVGFNDGFLKYNLSLKQPKDFKDADASSIFSYALTVIGIQEKNRFDFSGSNEWQYKNQSTILFAPGAGNIDRCFSIEQFILLIRDLKYENIAFVLGPNDLEIRNVIPVEFEVIYTSNIRETISILSNARLLIASEGGFMHIAASYGIPLVGLFNVATIANWFPYKNKYQIGIGEGSDNYQDIPNNKIDLKSVLIAIIQIYESFEN